MTQVGYTALQSDEFYSNIYLKSNISNIDYVLEPLYHNEWYVVSGGHGQVLPLDAPSATKRDK
jgi:hypothetical protein